MSETKTPRRVAVLGSSGSIGRSALEVIAHSEGRLEALLLSVHRRTDILVEQIRQMAVRSVADSIHAKESDRTSSDSAHFGNGHNVTSLPRWVVVTDEDADRTPLEDLPKGIDVFFGQDALCELLRRPEVDVVLSAIVGSAGLTSTWCALEAGKAVALANKETLVMGGSLITELAKRTGGRLIPVDSEHSAILQALQCWRLGTEIPPNPLPRAGEGNDKPPFQNAVIEKLILTASGGPFRTWSTEELSKVTVESTLAHPTWKMGTET